MDASHLQLTVNKCLNEGIADFAFIHDSYATHAANTDQLAYLLREAFIEQYGQYDVLENFYKEILQQLPPELALEIPPVPPKGKLDLEAVRKSKYFFA
jgi:DNA-directed RNA polymerase